MTQASSTLCLLGLCIAWFAFTHLSAICRQDCCASSARCSSDLRCMMKMQECWVPAAVKLPCCWRESVHHHHGARGACDALPLSWPPASMLYIGSPSQPDSKSVCAAQSSHASWYGSPMAARSQTRRSADSMAVRRACCLMAVSLCMMIS